MIAEEIGTLQAPALDVYVAPMGEVALRHSAMLAGEIRNLDLSVEVGTEPKLKRMLEIANKLRARYTLLLGDEEIVTHSYTLKDMSSGDQARLTRQELLERLAADR